MLFGKSIDAPLKAVLIIPFFIQLFVATGVVGFLCWASGQHSVEELADELLIETGKRVTQHLDQFLGKAQDVNRINVKAFESGLLNLDDFQRTGQYFYHQVRLLDLFYVNFGGKDGNFIGSGYGENGLEIDTIFKSNRDRTYFHSVDDGGNIISERSEDNLGILELPWYVDAEKLGKELWSSIYIWREPKLFITISASTPVYDQTRQFAGVFGVDLSLTQISDFLKTLSDRRVGRIFIVERNGDIVASSSNEAVIPVIDGKPTRLSSFKSQDAAIHDLALDLVDRFGDLTKIELEQSLRPALDGNPFVRVIPYKKGSGIDWLIVLTTPDSQFMAEIWSSVQYALALCLGVVLVLVVIGIATSNAIARPILEVVAATKNIANGEMDELRDVKGITELRILAKSFNHMSAKLRLLFSELERKVLERTEELFVANQKLERLAQLDSLTGIPNRRYFDETIERDWGRLLRSRGIFSLILIDVDFFKAYNDTYGHLAGDDCLRKVARGIAQAIKRPADFCARYGGEEFVCGLPETDFAGAMAVAKAIHESISALAICHDGSSVSDQVTVSIGVVTTACFPEFTPSDVVALADKQLYRAKSGGRNRSTGLDQISRTEAADDHNQSFSGGPGPVIGLSLSLRRP